MKSIRLTEIRKDNQPKGIRRKACLSVLCLCLTKTLKSDVRLNRVHIFLAII